MSQNPDIHNPQDPEVVLIPDWLKLKMIRSEVPSLVDAALVELDPQQLVLFIQSFGIPVPRYFITNIFFISKRLVLFLLIFPPTFSFTVCPNYYKNLIKPSGPILMALKKQ